MSESYFAGKIALIAGGTSGIGLGTARALRSAGAQVVITGRSAAELDTAANTLGPNVLALRADSRSVSDCQEAARTVGARFGRVDVVFINAGVSVFLPVSMASEADWDDCFSVNVKGGCFLVQSLLPWLTRGSSIIFNSSIAADRPGPCTTIYGASKAAVTALARSLAVEHAPRGVRVNVLNLGPIDTELSRRTKGLDPEQASAFVSQVAERTLLKRQGAIAEAAAAVLFLASESASYITGSELRVDGGALCC